jgi:diguanylate cyclase (GGDEF)-like protein
LPDQSAVPLIVLTKQQDHVEIINSTLRNAGHAVHCSWIRDLAELGDALNQIPAEMLLAYVSAETDDPAAVLEIRNQGAANVPVVLLRESVDEDHIVEGMRLGARDVVSLGNRDRLRAVVTRELEAHRLARALQQAGDSARLYRDQLQAFLAGSADAIAQVQEGIVVDANPAWLELFGYPDGDAIVGQPLMDMFDPECHVALKGALIACLQSKWPEDRALRALGIVSDSSSVPLEIGLARTEFEAEPAVRLSIEARRHDTRALEQQLSDAIERDATTGFVQRRHFVNRLGELVARPLKGGVRQLAAIQPDKFDAIEVELGPIAIDDFIAAFAELLREQLQDGDLAGRFGDGTFLVLLERGTPRDIEAWASGLTRRIATHTFQIREQSVAATCSVGIGLIDARNGEPQRALTDALRARRRAEEDGGSRVRVLEHSEDDTRRVEADKLWVRQIKSALMENRFRLVQQPIASLLGQDAGMFDVLVRMIDDQGKEILPSEFIAAAERNDLMKNVDRWVIAAAMAFCANRPQSRLFIRLSRDSVRDESLVAWIGTQLKTLRPQPGRLVFEISETIANQQLTETTALATALRAAGFGFAIEHFGNGRDPSRLLAQVPLDFVKIEGSLMQGLTADPDLQAKVKALVDEARSRKVATIAERVEDANTMAVLWQLGIEFIQGYFVHQPEEVVIG